MNAEEALDLVESFLQDVRLNKLQRIVFQYAWQDQSYKAMAQHCGYELGYVKQAGSQLWQLLSRTFNEKVTKHNLQLVVQRQILAGEPAKGYAPRAIAASGCTPTPTRSDWGDAVSVSSFYGRTQELARLNHWILHDRCRLIGVFGMGGIGKTSLAVKLGREIQAQFDCVIWRSLRNAPPLADLLTDLLQVLATPSDRPAPTTEDTLILAVLQELRRSRCLILLDNGETVMRQGDLEGGYYPGYDAYGRLWQHLGQLEHQSTVLLTSREKPKEIAALEGKGLPTRSLRLGGLPPQDGQALLQIKGEFWGTEQDWQTLVAHYAGNPLALNMVATVIQDVFDGCITDFLNCLQGNSAIFGDIQDLLAQQMNRLSSLERQVMDGLAIARKPISLNELRTQMLSTVSLGQLLAAFTALERRCLIDKTKAKAGDRTLCFTLQPAVMEYVTTHLIDRVYRELDIALTHRRTTSLPFRVLHTHPLIQAQAKDYIRETQTRLILQPIADRLRTHYPLADLTELFQWMVAQLRQQRPRLRTYAAGNLVNLLCALGIDLQGWDFSCLTLWSVYLRQVTLHHVNLNHTEITQSAFTETLGQILAIAFSPNGKLLATGDVNHELRLWEVASGKHLWTVRVDEGWIWSVAFSPDGRWLASSANRVVHLWDVQTGTCVRTLEGYSDRVFSVSFSADGQWLATGSEDHLVRIWQVHTGTLRHTLQGHRDEVRSVAFLAGQGSIPSSTQSDWLASGSYDGTVQIWRASTGERLRVLTGHQDWVWSVAWSSDGSTLASASSDRTIRLWNGQTGACQRILTGHSQPIRALAISADGQTLASAGNDRTLRLWHLATGDCQRVIPAHRSWISCLSISPDQGWIASGSEDQSVRLWDPRSSLCCKTLQGYSNGIWCTAFDPTGSLVASGSQDRQVRLWNRQTGALLHTLTGHSSWIWAIAFSPHAHILGSSSEDRTVRLWDLDHHQCLHVLEGHQDAVLSMLFHPSYPWLYSGSLDGTIRQWHSETGDCLCEFTGHQGGIWCLTLSADGRYLISGSQDQTVVVWDTTKGEPIQTLTQPRSWVRCVALTPDQRMIISGSADGVIHFWDWRSGTCLQTLPAHRGPVLSVAVHPKGKQMVSSSTDGTIQVWSLPDARWLDSVSSHDRWVRHLSFSADGQTLASCSQDETIKLWHWMDTIPTLEHLLRIPRPYEGMAIAHVTGLTPAQRENLRALGAIAESSSNSSQESWDWMR